MTAGRGPSSRPRRGELAPTLAEAAARAGRDRGPGRAARAGARRSSIPAAGDARAGRRELRARSPPRADFVGAAAGSSRRAPARRACSPRGSTGQAERDPQRPDPGAARSSSASSSCSSAVPQRRRPVRRQRQRRHVGQPRAGTYGQFDILNFEASPEGFGLRPGGRAQPRTASRRGWRAMLAEMLERTCRDTNPAACLLRFRLPGLPASRSSPDAHGSGALDGPSDPQASAS